MVEAVTPKRLTSQAFAPFGDVIEARDSSAMMINRDTSTRFHDLAAIDVDADDGRALVNIFRATPYPAPLLIRMMEKHPLGSQLFMPLEGQAYLVAVAPPSAKVVPGDISVFIALGNQGVNFRPGTWHHPLLALAPQDFLVIDREGSGENLVEQALDQPLKVEADTATL
ncbi:MAG: ureidoglycolate lyase [Arenicellales bacterium]|jgi:ureidoglycolate lyase|nr:ureidoglycolate lyase [Arenicellales bacterium]MDP6948031.1 ureidoglycolate lyase [Arenicellales bacterium]|tara:strand:- start:75 stop:581 length:507 start_codon:yes stop_codon:yes gene_type:complete